MPPVPERLSKIRWAYLLFTSRHSAVRFLYYPPAVSTGLRQIRLYDREGYDIGVLAWTVCATCERGRIHKISITVEWQRLGLGRRLIRRAVRGGQTYRWTTSGQSPDAKAFFPTLSAETGHEFEERGGQCSHMRSAPASSTRRRLRPRPVLDRTV